MMNIQEVGEQELIPSMLYACMVIVICMHDNCYMHACQLLYACMTIVICMHDNCNER